MKTAKILIVLLALASASVLHAKSGSEDDLIRIQLNKVISNQEFMKATYNQVSQSLIDVERNGYYTARVLFREKNYLVYGKLEEWQNFFLMDPVSPLKPILDP